MTELAQALVGGILIGGLYVAISIGFSLSFGVLDVVDLAVGMWVVLGAFAAIVASDTLGVDAFLLLPVVFVVFGVVGWLIAPLIYRVRTSKYALPALMGLAFTFGLATLIRGGLLTMFGYTPRTVRTEFFSGNVELSASPHPRSGSPASPSRSSPPACSSRSSSTPAPASRSAPPRRARRTPG